MKKLLLLGVIFTAFTGVTHASVLKKEVSLVKKEASFSTQNNYITVVVVKTASGAEIEINGVDCALRYIEQMGGKIIGYRSVPASGPTPFRCADLPGSDGSDSNVIRPGQGGGGSSSNGGGGKHKFKHSDAGKDVFN